MNYRNPFAIHIDTGELIHISDYGEYINELDKLICPECRQPLYLKAEDSDKVITHFSHYNLEECTGSYETALHLFAKDVFVDNVGNVFRLPSIKEMIINDKEFINELYKYVDGEYNNYRRNHENMIRGCGIRIGGWYIKQYHNNLITDTKEHFRSQIADFLKEYYVSPEYTIEIVEIERNIAEGIVADVWINNTLNIEIFVSHKIDSEKELKLKSNSIKTIEIDLSQISDKEIFDKSKVVHYIFNGFDNKKIINTELFEEYNHVSINELKRDIKKEILEYYINKFDEQIVKLKEKYLELEKLKEIQADNAESIKNDYDYKDTLTLYLNTLFAQVSISPLERQMLQEKASAHDIIEKDKFWRCLFFNNENVFLRLHSLNNIVEENKRFLYIKTEFSIPNLLNDQRFLYNLQIPKKMKDELENIIKEQGYYDISQFEKCYYYIKIQ